jgi:hypothetical protein
VDVFYCFVLWEGQELRWISRRLPDEDIVDSHTSSGNNVDSYTNRRNETKEDKRIQRLRDAINGPGESKDVAEAKKRVLDEKANETMQIAKTNKAQRLSDAIGSAQFQTLPDEKQQAIMDAWLEALL